MIRLDDLRRAPRAVLEDDRERARAAITFAEMMFATAILLFGYSELFVEDFYSWVQYTSGLGLLAIVLVAWPALRELDAD